MEILVLIITLCILVAGCVVEIGITSWNIRRAKRYQCRKNAADQQKEAMKEQMEAITTKFRSLDKYATDISWLLRFLYNRYGQFADIDKEIEEGVQVKTDNTPIVELDEKFQDLKRAVKIIRTTVRAYEKIEGFMGSIASQLNSIIEDLEVDDEEDEEAPDEKDDSQPKASEASAPVVTDDPAMNKA
jgi:hypothetical protein